MTTRTTKIAPGLYQFSLNGRTFQVEDIHQASDGEIAPGWMVYEVIRGSREYLNDYSTKRQAIENTVAGISEETVQ